MSSFGGLPARDCARHAHRSTLTHLEVAGGPAGPPTAYSGALKRTRELWAAAGARSIQYFSVEGQEAKFAVRTTEGLFSPK